MCNYKLEADLLAEQIPLIFKVFAQKWKEFV